MSIADRLFNRLKADQQSFALDALRRPQNRDAFEYGYRVGMIAGYDAAINLILQLLKEEKDDNNDL